MFLETNETVILSDVVFYWCHGYFVINYTYFNNVGNMIFGYIYYSGYLGKKGKVLGCE